MKNFIASLAALTLLMLVPIASADDSGGASFLAFNGGASEFDNDSFQEDYIHFLQDGFFQGKGIVLNAAGPSAQTIPYDRNLNIIRTDTGEVKFRATTLPNSIEANQTNLEKSVNSLAQKNPKAVTLFFGDHGAGDSLAGWHQTISYSTIQAIDGQFDPNTIVRRIHFHCFSGAAVHTVATGPINLLSKYPKNRCAFAVSKEDEVATSFNAPLPNGTLPLDSLKNKRPAPSLNDFKNLVSSLDTSASTPELTSDYFVQDLSRGVCGSGPPICSGEGPLTRQTERLQSVLAGDFCANVASSKEKNDLSKREIAMSVRSYTHLTDLRSKFTYDYVKEYYPKAYQAFTDTQGAKEELIECQTLHATNCDRLKAEVARLAMQADPTEFNRRIIALNSSKTTNRDYTQQLNAFYSINGSTTGICSTSETPMKCIKRISSSGAALPSFDQDLNKAEDEMLRFQRDRKKILVTSQANTEKALNTYLDLSQNKELKARLQNIRACETTPINQTIL